MSKIFLSHATKDISLVNALVDLLQTGIGIPFEAVFCSSISGQGIEPGKDFKNQLKQEIKNSEVIMALLTPDFFNSAFCMCELGSAWMLSNSILPIIAPPLTYNDLKAILEGTQAIKLYNPNDIDMLRENLLTLLNIDGLPVVRWNEKKAKFLEELPQYYRQISEERILGEQFINRYLPQIAKGIANNTNRDLWVVVADVDGHKHINQKYGISIGDEVLLYINTYLAEIDIRSIYSGRCGDDTYYSIILGTRNDVADFANDLVDAVRQFPSKMDISGLWVTCSVGAAKYDENDVGMDWIHRGYAGCKTARENGGNKFEFGKKYSKFIVKYDEFS